MGRYQGVTGTNDGAIAGALVLPGYLVLGVVGAFLFEVSTTGTTGRPDLPAVILLAGILYPLVFGAVGGVVAAVTADEDEPSGRRSPS